MSRAAVCAAALALLAGCCTGTAAPRVTQSPSYWHWLDEHVPLDEREDTAHYLTEQQQQPRENFEEVHTR